MWHVYIVCCKDKTFYTGTSTDVNRRVKEHNCKKGSRYTRSRLPVRLVYKEACSNKSKALKREAEIKAWTRKEKLNLIGSHIWPKNSPLR